MRIWLAIIGAVLLLSVLAAWNVQHTEIRLVNTLHSWKYVLAAVAWFFLFFAAIGDPMLAIVLAVAMTGVTAVLFSSFVHMLLSPVTT